MKGVTPALLCLLTLLSTTAAAQSSGRGTATGELIVGHAGFVDDATIHHLVVGGALRWTLSPRVSVGPEVVYMRGPHGDRDVMVTGNVTFDFLPPAPDRVVTPFLLAGAGWFRHRELVGTGPYSSSDPAFTVGGGLRAHISDRWYIGGDARLGWELHTRVVGVVGFRFP